MSITYSDRFDSSSRLVKSSSFGAFVFPELAPELPAVFEEEHPAAIKRVKHTTHTHKGKKNSRLGNAKLNKELARHAFTEPTYSFNNGVSTLRPGES